AQARAEAFAGDAARCFRVALNALTPGRSSRAAGASVNSEISRANAKGTGMTGTLMTVGEVAEALHVSPLPDYRRVESGELQAVKLGEGPKARLRLEPDEVDRYSATHRQDETTPWPRSPSSGWCLRPLTSRYVSDL